MFDCDLNTQEFKLCQDLNPSYPYSDTFTAIAWLTPIFETPILYKEFSGAGLSLEIHAVKISILQARWFGKLGSDITGNWNLYLDT